MRSDHADPIVLRELSYQVMAAAFEVHKLLGSGFLEKVYENAFSRELAIRKILAECQKEIKVFYKGHEIGSYITDLVIEGQILVELKAVDKLIPLHEAQLLNYLKATGIKLGLLINFGAERVEYKRLVF